MEQQEYVSPSIDVEPEEEKSAFDRFAAAFTAPTEAFRGLVTTRKAPIIAWGLIIASLVAAFSVIMTTSNEELYEKGLDKRREAIEKMHDSGKMKDDVYKVQIEAIDSASRNAAMIPQAIGAMIVVTIISLLLGAIALVILKVLQRDSGEPITFGTALSMYLISSMISFVGGIINVIIKVVTVNPMADLSPSLFVDTDSFLVSFLLGIVSPFTIWWFYVAGVGTSTLSRAPLGKSIAIWAGVYIIGGVFIFGGLELLMGMIGFG